MAKILWFSDLTSKDIEKVGGKNASLGEMYNRLPGVPLPNGFAITTEGYQEFLEANQLDAEIAKILTGLDTNNIASLQDSGQKIRNLIKSAPLPTELVQEIKTAYNKLSQEFSSTAVDAAVRSSATTEDTLEASSAGQQATFLNIVGEESLLTATKNCFASLFTDRAISYRADKKLDSKPPLLSVGVQKMIRSDKASAGVVFTLHPETGFPGIVVVNSSWGLGELVVQGKITPDEFQIFKEGLKRGFPSIISRELGSKEKTLVYGEAGQTTKLVKTPLEKTGQFSLRDDEVLRLSNWAVQIEDYYKKPMDIEWAKDAFNGELYIVQARPETIHSAKSKRGINRYIMNKGGQLAVKGAAVGTKIIEGKARVISDPSKIRTFEEGEILVTDMTVPDWEPILKIASAIVTDEGGRISHAAILAQELGITAVVGTHDATKKISTGETITVDCSQGNDGFVWSGKPGWEMKTYSLEDLEQPKTKVLLKINNPYEAYESYFLPNDGVGLAKEEFIIASHIKIHPLALVNFESLTDPSLKETIENLTKLYRNKTDYYIQRLASDLAQIAAAFYPKQTVVRFSDFSTHEYSKLLGGGWFEPKDESPAALLRGAARFIDKRFFEAFGLECQAIKTAREVWGLENMVVMIPFCQSRHDGEKVLENMAKFGLQKGTDGLKVYLTVELPANIDEASELSEVFDGFVVDLDALAESSLGVDLENAFLGESFVDITASVIELVTKINSAAAKHQKSVSVFGDRFTSQDKFIESMVKIGVQGLAVSPDSVIKTTLTILKTESSLLQKQPPT